MGSLHASGIALDGGGSTFPRLRSSRISSADLDVHVDRVGTPSCMGSLHASGLALDGGGHQFLRLRSSRISSADLDVHVDREGTPLEWALFTRVVSPLMVVGPPSSARAPHASAPHTLMSTLIGRTPLLNGLSSREWYRP